MKRLLLTLLAGLSAIVAAQARPVVRVSRESRTVQSATEILVENTKTPDKCIPAHLLQKAEGVLIVPHMIKGGFVVGGSHGRGVLLVRTREGWSNPIFVSMTGGSVGWQVGVQSTDMVLVFTTPRSVERLLKGKGKFTLGGDASVAAGPAGRQSTASTDLQLKAEIYSYSRSRGAFLGLSLDGSALLVDHRSNADYYGKAVNPAELLTGAGLLIHESALSLRTVLTNMTAPPRIIVPAPVPVPALPPPGQ